MLSLNIRITIFVKGALNKEITKKIFQTSKTFYEMKTKRVTYDGNSVYVGSALVAEIRRNNGNFEIYHLRPNLERVDSFDRVLQEIIPVESFKN